MQETININILARRNSRVGIEVTPKVRRIALKPLASGRLWDVTHAPDATQGWCGPSAMSALTSRTAEVAAATLNGIRGDASETPITGTEIGEVSQAMNRLGYLLNAEYVTEEAYAELGTPVPDASVTVGPSLTLSEWAASRAHPKRTRLLDVTVDGSPHWIAVRGDKVVDSLNPNGSTLADYGYATVVRRVWEVKLLTGRLGWDRRAA